jgi:protein-disulfide isomerase
MRADSAAVKDSAAFARCMRDSTYMNRVQADADAGRQLNVRGTPTVLVNGLQLREPATRAVLERLIEAELARGGGGSGSVASARP